MPNLTKRTTYQVSDAATFALNNTRPSMASQRPSRVWTLFATATWVWKSGSPALLSRCTKATATGPGDVDLPHAVRADPGKQGVLLDEPQRIPDRRVMRDLDR